MSKELWEARKEFGLAAPTLEDVAVFSLQTKGPWEWRDMSELSGTTVLTFTCRIAETYLSEVNFFQLAVDEVPRCCAPHGVYMGKRQYNEISRTYERENGWNNIWL